MTDWNALATAEVECVQAELPPAVRAAALRVPVFLRDDPATDDPRDGDLLGLAEGASLRDGEPFDAASLPRITLFVERLREWTENHEEDFREEVRVTYLHELGHFLGWDEDEVAARGLE